MVEPMDLDRLFNPSTLAVVGASADRRKTGARFLKSLVDGSYTGKLYPVNPNESTILGLPVCPSVSDLPEGVDVAIVTVPSAAVPGVIAECSRRGVRFAVVHSAGFAELGPDGKRLEAEMLRQAGPGRTRVIGPNCMGLYVPRARINTVVEGLGLEPGGLAFIGQSGWVTENVIEMGYERGLRFSKVVSIGNQSDLTIEDVLEYLADDIETRAIGLYVEGLKRGRDFVRVAKEASMRKPVIVWKAGRTQTGVRAAASHTGSLAGNAAVFAAAMAQTGMVAAHGLEELLDMMVAFASPVLPTGKRVALLVEAGGGAVSGSDAAESLGLEVPTFSAGLQHELLRVLEGALPPFAPPRNPVDLVWPTRNAAAIILHCAHAMLTEADALMMLNYQPWDERFVASMVRLCGESGKPVFIVPGHPVQRRAGMEQLTRAGIPAFVTPEQAIRCLAAAHRYVHWARTPVGPTGPAARRLSRKGQ